MAHSEPIGFLLSDSLVAGGHSGALRQVKAISVHSCCSDQGCGGVYFLRIMPVLVMTAPYFLQNAGVPNLLFSVASSRMPARTHCVTAGISLLRSYSAS